MKDKCDTGRRCDCEMALLDWFAGRALAGLTFDLVDKESIDNAVCDAWNIAEKMLAEKRRRECEEEARGLRQQPQPSPPRYRRK